MTPLFKKTASIKLTRYFSYYTSEISFYTVTYVADFCFDKSMLWKINFLDILIRT